MEREALRKGRDQTMKTVFVSGHMHLTNEEFEKHYAPKIEALLAAEGGTHFLVADAPLFDAKVQGILADSGAKVTVYHMKTTARNNAGSFPTVGGFETAEARDAAMTAASEEDLAWVRPGHTHSGVGDNVKRRNKLAGVSTDEEQDPNEAFNKQWAESQESEEEDESESDVDDDEDSDEDDSDENEGE